MHAEKKLGSLEIGRFLAALVVVFNHIPYFMPHFADPFGAPFLGGWYAPGQIGIIYFFVLSGFVMYSAHHADIGTLTGPLKFWWRRAARIYPVYWLALAIMTPLLIFPITPLVAFEMISLCPVNVAHEFVDPAWTLRFELAFYIMFGLAMLPRIGRFIFVAWVFLVCWLAAPAWLAPFAGDRPASLPSHVVSPFCLFFFAGLAAAWLFIHHPPGRRTSLAAIAAGLTVLGLCIGPTRWYYFYLLPPGMTAQAAGCASLLLGIAGLDRQHGRPAGPRTRFLGALTYPLYILHIPLIFAFDRFFWNTFSLRPFGLFILFTMVTTIIVLTSAVVTKYIDIPLQRALRRLFSRPTVIPAQASIHDFPA
jgi:peptidoglycan/LPS O-acetylase OafA/YrhL